MGNIISVEDLAAEGLTADGRAEGIIDQVERDIEAYTGFRFYGHEATFTLDGSGIDVLALPQPCLRLDSVTEDGTALTVGTDFVLYNRRPPGADDRRYPRLIRLTPALVTSDELQAVWKAGRQNVVVVGRWGFTELVGTVEQPPAVIRRAALRWVALELVRLGVEEEVVARRIRLYATSLGDSGPSASFAPQGIGMGPTGDPDLDRVLREYRHPRRGTRPPFAFAGA